MIGERDQQEQVRQRKKRQHRRGFSHAKSHTVVFFLGGGRSASGYLLVWVGGLDSWEPYERDCYLNPKPTINH